MHVIFLYASTGCGHLKAAEYIREALMDMDYQMDIHMMDVLDLQYFPVESFMLNIFKLLVSKCPCIYRLLYRHTYNIACVFSLVLRFFSRRIAYLKV